eukprot:CAMPEP_0119341568 /NCGR_PEP_ID=MMETSP1333-20130426/102707_1 /TAXON_ID=418940 /ORGANISM="Scyphosphaera apsteinii, Strain RCC1455" /LENGTH=169 /DNA_ID=CAMNT_0007353563 /DNA_START=67 /DNA_END=576 /DNA_ORIENTATION=+
MWLNMMSAAARGDAKRITDLLDAGEGKALETDSFNRTPLHSAAYNHGTPETVKVLVEAGGNIDAKDNDGRTPLHLAVLANDSLAPALLEHGATADMTDKNGNTALHLAAQCGKIEVAKVLLAAGVSADSKDQMGTTPLEIAQRMRLVMSQEKVLAMTDLLMPTVLAPAA